MLERGTRELLVGVEMPPILTEVGLTDVYKCPHSLNCTLKMSARYCM